MDTTPRPGQPSDRPSLPTDLGIDELVRSAAAQDRDAFALLFDRTIGPVYRAASLLTGSADRADDVTRQAYADLWRNAADVHRGPGCAMAWLLARVRLTAELPEPLRAIA